MQRTSPRNPTSLAPGRSPSTHKPPPMPSTNRRSEADTALEDPNTVQFPFQFDLISKRVPVEVFFLLLINVGAHTQRRRRPSSSCKRRAKFLVLMRAASLSKIQNSFCA